MSSAGFSVPVLIKTCTTTLAHKHTLYMKSVAELHKYALNCANAPTLIQN